MPSTEFFGVSALNLGPLTTTFTAPSSCATQSDHQIFANATSPHFPYQVAESCTMKPFGDCYPSGEKWESEKKQTTKFVQGAYQYFSPGIACPKGWETVGLLKHGNSTGQFGISGVLTVSGDPGSYGIEEERQPLQPTDFWKNVLDRSETMAVCCPTNYIGDTYGFCRSMIAPVMSYPGSPEVCYVESGYDGDQTTVTVSVGPTKTVGLISNIPNESATVTTRTKIATARSDELTLFSYGSYVPAVTLIYKEEDVEGKSGNGDGETTTGSDETTATGETTAAETTASDESAAAGIQRGGVVSLFGVTLGLLAGAGVLVGW
ncbi:hypothetical protein NW752_003460 [Fusarium irregulare]|nr:hypothetical protein NW752_003460 [Fusarium irregulare]